MSLANKLIIGAAQFGQNYGVTNKLGSVSEKEIQAILSRAIESGVNAIDTARAYGNSEAILGKIGVSEFEIYTKLPSPACEVVDYNDFVRSQLSLSLNSLKRPKIKTLLFHSPDDLLSSQGDKVYRAVLNMKKEGLVDEIGVSIYGPEVLEDIISAFDIDMVQAPLNVFDQRMIQKDWISKLNKKNIQFIARSLFLQGTLLNDPKKLISYFSKWHANFDEWSQFCISNNVSQLQACMQFVCQISEVKNFIVGVENEAQFSEVVDSLKQPFEADFCQFVSDDLDLIDPRRWKI